VSNPSLTADPRTETDGFIDRHRSVQKPPLHVMIPDCNSLTTATSEPSKTLTVVEPGAPAGLKPMTAAGSFRAAVPAAIVWVVVSGWNGGELVVGRRCTVGGGVFGGALGGVGGTAGAGSVVVGT